MTWQILFLTQMCKIYANKIIYLNEIDLHKRDFFNLFKKQSEQKVRW